ncbi:hypothetical protein KC19_3G178100 [Ceratodon purpureus]|uniref:DJ-1/PfpI domain-containing protein n=1 Tax=Ceratodon purpureus TaxID=3225 RepID=A0A8T0IL71_CERPU|nr:hypothetical protein KC19_3G178100 [Ceratodon purpureus]
MCTFGRLYRFDHSEPERLSVPVLVHRFRSIAARTSAMAATAAMAMAMMPIRTSTSLLPATRHVSPRAQSRRCAYRRIETSSSLQYSLQSELKNEVQWGEFESLRVGGIQGGRKKMDIHALANQINPATETPPAMKKVLVPVANGTEEMEAVIVIDVLRRAGATVTVASVEDGKQIKASRGVNLLADCLVSDCEAEDYDLVVLPGGMPGAERFRDSEVLKRITEKQVKEKRMFAAICAAPVVALQSWRLLEGLHATCHPSFASKLEDKAAVESSVVRDSLLTTSRGPGTAFDFALALVEQLYGAEKVPSVAGPMVLPPEDGTDCRAVKFNDEEWSTMSSTPTVLVPIANDSEEMEVVIIVDVLRRAGVKVVVASVELEKTIIASRSVQLIADVLISEVMDTQFDLVLLPGGMPGADRLKKSAELCKILNEQADEGRCYGAICAAPAVVLESIGLLQSKKATSHPAFSNKLSDQSVVESRVVIDGRVITSRGPGTAMEFTLNVVEKLCSRVKAQEIGEAMVFDYL